MSTRHTRKNPFLHTPINLLFIRQALPMTLVMLMNGLFNLIDAAFLGYYVGIDALTAISVTFPMIIFMIALSSLISGGMSSLLARHLGSKKFEQAEATFVQAHGLSLFIALSWILFYLLIGKSVLNYMIDDAQSPVAEMAHIYLLIAIFTTPLQFLLGIHADTWRNEGYVGLIAILSIGITLTNIALNYLLIVVFQLGVAGSAYGTLVAQLLGLLLLIVLRITQHDVISMNALKQHSWLGGWRTILKLGAPLSLSFIGLSLVATIVIVTLRLSDIADYADTVTAYGIVTRIFSFTFLPLMAIALTTQSIVGNNVGAGLTNRSDATLRLALLIAFVYCLIVETGLLASSHNIWVLFIKDTLIIAKVSHVLTPMILGYFIVGPMLVLAMYFQAVGQPLRTALLALVKPFVFIPLLIIALATLVNAERIWFAFFIADIMIAIIALTMVIKIISNNQTDGFGLQRG